MSTLGTLRVLRLEAHVPPTGAWLASVWLDSSTLPAVGQTTLTVGDLELVGSVIRTDFDDHPGGALAVAVVRGGPGWRLPVTRAGSYAGGVRLVTVLRDLATMAGEPIAEPTDADLGTAYRWEAHSPTAPVHREDVLNELVTRGYLPTWRVEPFTGRTRFDAWPSIGAADGRGRVLSRSTSRGRRTVGLDVVTAAFLPGATLEDTVIRRTILRESAGKLRAEVFEQ